MLVELHLLQNFAPSCLNRDDTNAPKDCVFGGCRRARISSQCLKRAIRWHPEFTEPLGHLLGLRTKGLVALLAGEVATGGRDPVIAREVATAVISAALALVGPDGQTRVLLHVGADELAALGGLLRDHWDALAAAAGRGAGTALPKLARQLAADLKLSTRSPDIALFGRMVAENAHLNVEAACQMAHALSTHRATIEMDFFTAVDDLKPGTRGQAEMLGALEFCSACFYRYATVHWEQLTRNLQGDTALARATLAAFLRAAVAAVPLGRQHGAAALSPPSFALAVVRERGMPWSLVNAFETPVWVPDHDRQGLVARSVAALDAYWHGLAQMYGTAGIVASPACWLSRAEAPHLRPHRVPDLDALVARVLEALPLTEGAA